jgi:hypothetical protein
MIANKILTSPNRKHIQAWGLGIVIFLALVAAFSYIPWLPGDDWENFVGAARRILAGDPLYGQIIVHDYYVYPPWVAVLLLPLAVLPQRVGSAVLSTLTLFVSLLLLRRWLPRPGLVKPFLMLLSPPIFYIIIHGQIDALILLGIFLPVEWWWLVAISKPQITLGLAAGVPPKRWIRAGLITTVVLVDRQSSK